MAQALKQQENRFLYLGKKKPENMQKILRYKGADLFFKTNFFSEFYMSRTPFHHAAQGTQISHPELFPMHTCDTSCFTFWPVGTWEKPLGSGQQRVIFS